MGRISIFMDEQEYGGINNLSLDKGVERLRMTLKIEILKFKHLNCNFQSKTHSILKSKSVT